MLRATLDDGSEVLVDPARFEEFLREYGHRVVPQQSTLPRGATETELQKLKALLEEPGAPEDHQDTPQQ